VPAAQAEQLSAPAPLVSPVGHGAHVPASLTPLPEAPGANLPAPHAVHSRAALTAL
jgi:hypothetical protein